MWISPVVALSLNRREWPRTLLFLLVDVDCTLVGWPRRLSLSGMICRVRLREICAIGADQGEWIWQIYTVDLKRYLLYWCYS